MRGKVLRWLFFPRIRRITPAYAGKRTHTIQPMHRWKDHPRLCGEKLKKRLNVCVSKGSPPPMRGKELGYVGKTDTYRITPAYAGKSPNFLMNRQKLEDHPRLCGEKELSSVALSPHKGSPPPMRGKGLAYSELFVPVRITPAYAGKS